MRRQDRLRVNISELVCRQFSPATHPLSRHAPLTGIAPPNNAPVRLSRRPPQQPRLSDEEQAVNFVCAGQRKMNEEAREQKDRQGGILNTRTPVA